MKQVIKVVYFKKLIAQADCVAELDDIWNILYHIYHYNIHYVLEDTVGREKFKEVSAIWRKRREEV